MMYPGFNAIKYFYDINCYTNEDIATYVQLNCIDKDEYKQITGEDYDKEETQAQ